jgi:hypothetical protein
MREPRAGPEPSRFAQQIERPAAPLAHRRALVRPRVEVHVQPACVRGRDLREAAHVARLTIRDARRSDRHLQHRAARRVVMAAQRCLQLRKQRILAVEQPVELGAHHRSQPLLEIALHRGHAAADEHEPDAGLARAANLLRRHLAIGLRHQVREIGVGRAARREQLAVGGERRAVIRVGVDLRPDRVHREQPVEDRRARGEGHRARQCLEQVMMDIDEARRHQAAGDGDFLVHGECRSWLGSDGRDAAVLDVHVAVADDTARIVARVDGVGVAKQQLGMRVSD